MLDREDWNDTFQQAALDPSLWLGALRKLASATGSARGQLIGVGGANIVPFNWVNDFSDQALADFVALGGTSPRLNYRIAADLDGRSGAVAYEADYRRVCPHLANDSYVEFCEANEIPFGCHSALVVENETMVGLALLRTLGDGVTTEEQRATFASAASAARAAVRMQRAIGHQGIDLVTGTLEAMTTACLFLDGFGRIGAMTPPAERAIAEGYPLAVLDGILTGARSDFVRRIARALAEMATGQASANVLLDSAWRLDFFALPKREWTMGFAPRIVAVLVDVSAKLAAASETLACEFALSPTETRIAHMLASGMRRAAIAGERGVSAETLKSQIKTIFQKSGCSRKSELVALVANRNFEACCQFNMIVLPNPQCRHFYFISEV